MSDRFTSCAHGDADIYRSTTKYIERKLGESTGAPRARARLALDLADVLTGPTSAANAQRLADALCLDIEKAAAVAYRLQEIAHRFRDATEVRAGDTGKGSAP